MIKIRYYFQAIRFYSLPMSILCSIMAVITSFKISNGNIFYGILGAFGVILVHIGVNLFDDVIDTILKSPKQGYKTKYLDDKIFSLKDIIIFTFIHFIFASFIGCYFLYKTGFELLCIIIPTIIIALIYPRANHIALGEILIGIVFGPLLFEGIYYIMTFSFSKYIFLYSIPSAILVSYVAFVHSLMDMEFDKKSGKYTLVILLDKLGLKLPKPNGQKFLKNFMTAQMIFIIYSILYILFWTIK